jgi:glycosyltransferase involved in cell wall biosynthesis/SAM-dependent methyltransferase
MLNACTIIACNYLPFAKVLVDSFFEHHPAGTFTILLIDDEQRQFSPEEERVSWRRLSDIGLDPLEVRRLAGIYDVTELATAVKPVLLRALLDEGADAVVYLDPDIRIYDSLGEVATLAARHAIVLTPHTTVPFPRDGRDVDSFFILAAGVYNLGFIAVGSAARPFLDWWWESTRREALIDVARMMFTDQRWVDFVPCIFDPYILKDPGYNVAYWNLHGRNLRCEEGRCFVDDAPLRFFHFSGFNVETPWLLSKHQGKRPRVLLSERPDLRGLCNDYRTRLLEAGISTWSLRPYGWGKMACGLAMTPRVRRLYWAGLRAAELGKIPEPPDPFDEQQPHAFVDWVNAPEEGGPRRVSRYLYSIYLDRLDLQIHFPDIFGADAARYGEWAWSDGAQQIGIPLEFLPHQRDVDPRAAPSEPPPLDEGVNLAGYFRAELGIGEAARLLFSAIEAGGIRFATTTYDATLNRQLHEFNGQSAGAGYDVNILCVNADSTPRFAKDVGPDFFTGRHTIGYWFWEIDTFPSSMHRAFDVVDEVWTATDFVAQAIRAAGRAPVFTVPIPVPVPSYPPGITREELGMPGNYLFLLSFDFLSIMERKNPLGLIRAFTRAFQPGEGPVLMLKSINGDLRLPDLERVRVEVAGRPDIIVLDAYYSAHQKNALVSLCDCYVSLHRSEGLGLTMAEAMAVGKPVIATGYSGNLHFMTPANSFLVDYTMRAVPNGCDPYPTTARWAEPDLDHAARLMREVYERPDDASARARLGQAEILEQHSAIASARAISRRLDEIRRDRRSRVAVNPPRVEPIAPRSAEAAVTEMNRLEATLPHLDQLSTPRLSVAGRSFPAARTTLQRAFFRFLRPYWFQQRQFHTELIGLLGQIVGAVRREGQERATLDDRVRTLTRELMASKRDIQRVGEELDSTLEDNSRRVDAELLRVQEVTAAFAAAVSTTHALEERTSALEPELAALRRASDLFQASASAHLGALNDVAGRTEAAVTTLGHKLYARPYMTDPELLRDQDGLGRERLGYRAQAGASSSFYLGFENTFRGPEALIRDRQRVYLPFLEDREQVIDIGCGRGEMLDVLGEAQVPAIGVDFDPQMISLCRSKGHRAEQMDALQFLQGMREASLPAIFCAQMIEHLTFDQLKEFLVLCRSRLRPDGVLIAETVNPHALEAFKTFYTDLTHQRPIFPEVALTLVRLAGFQQAYVMFPLGTGDLAEDRESRGEYAVVATVGDARPS